MIRIRVAKIEEIQNLSELIALSAKELSQHDYSEKEINSAIQYVFGVDTDLITDETYFVIEKNGELAGCGGWSKRKTLFGGDQFSQRENSLLDPKAEAAKIRAFFIHPKFARQGLGTQLLKHCEEQARAHGFIRLEMMATLPGVKLYKTQGYVLGTEEDVILPNQVSLKCIRMNKVLNQEMVAEAGIEPATQGFSVHKIPY